MSDYLIVLINSVASFIILFFIAKILGKKQIAELSFVDYVIGISIGSIVAEWATDVENPWYYYVIALGVSFIVSLLISILERTTLPLKHFLRGKPLIIIDKGKIDYKNLKKSKLDVNDVLGLCREKGYFVMQDIEYAIFETNGTLSILPIGEQKPLTLVDIGKKGQDSSLQKFIVDDGVIDKSYLEMINKDESGYTKF